MRLIPYPVRLPATETLEWLTRVFVSHDGSESREAQRAQPRQYLRQQIPLPKGLYPQARNDLFDNIVESWHIPLWTEAQEVTGEGVTFSAQFRVWGDWVLFYQRPTVYYLRKVVGYAAEEITVIEAVPSGTYYLMPVRMGKPDGTFRRRIDGFTAVFDIQWRVENNVTHETTPLTLYDGVEVILEPTLLPITADNFVEVVQVDGGRGVVEPFSSWASERQSRNFLVRAEPDDAQDLRAFWYRRAGRLNPFWMPTFEIDYNHVSLTANLLVIRKSNVVLDSLKHLAILGSKGEWYAREVISAVVSGDNIEVTLNFGIPDQMLSVSNLLLWRLDSDRIEMRYLGGGVVQTSVRIVTIP